MSTRPTHTTMPYPENTLTVRTLIEKLSALPEDQKDFQIEVEGCDCSDAGTGITVFPEEKLVSIDRD